MESYNDLALTRHQTDLLSLVLRGVRHERNMHQYRTQQHSRRRKHASHNATEQLQREVSALHRLCHPSNKDDGQTQEEDEVTLVMDPRLGWGWGRGRGHAGPLTVTTIVPEGQAKRNGDTTSALAC